MKEQKNKKEKKQQNSRTLRWLIKNAKGYKIKLAILSVSNIFMAFIGTALALVSKQAIDAAQGASKAATEAEFIYYKHRIIIFGILIFLIVFGRLLLRLYTQSLNIRVDSGLEKDLRSRLFRQILYKKIQIVHEYHHNTCSGIHQERGNAYRNDVLHKIRL